MTKQEFLEYSFDTYGTSPDYPFDEDFETAVLRHADNKKWYAIAMRVSRRKFGFDSDEVIDVINLKLPTEMFGSFGAADGVYPAYHMNKLHWISVVLPDAPDDVARFLVNVSFEATKGKKTRARHNNSIFEAGGYMDRTRLFKQYESEPNPEHWRDFPELMWDLGFEMDCYNSAPSFEALDWQTHTEKEIQDQLLSEMKSWTTQEVGNYIFSRYRELTHWSDYGYPEEKGAYFFERAFPMLQNLIDPDWDRRNTIPTLACFSEMVISRFKSYIDKNLIKQAEAFLKDEGRFHIQSKYSEYIEKAKESDFAIPKFYGVCVSETVSLLNDMF